MINRKLCAFLLVTLLCVSCNGNKIKSADISTRLAIQGVWQLSCSANSRSNLQRAYMTSRDTITGDELLSETNFFTDAECTLPGEPASRISKISLFFPGGITDTRLGKATHMNTTINVVEYDGVSLTEDKGESPYEFIGKDFFDLVLVKDNILYYGAWSKIRRGENASQRFNKLATAYPYKRQK